MTTTVGEAAVTEIRNLTFNDEDPIPALLELKQNYLNSDIFVSGDLAVDFPEDIQIPFTKNKHTTAFLNGTTLRLSYCPIESAIVYAQIPQCFVERTVYSGDYRSKNNQELIVNITSGCPRIIKFNMAINYTFI